MLETLKKWGCDMQGAMERFLQDEGFYQECYAILFQGTELEELLAHVQAGEKKEAFVCAHGIKGTVANLGLTPLYEQMVPIVDKLRQGETEGVLQQCRQVQMEWEKYQKLTETIS